MSISDETRPYFDTTVYDLGKESFDSNLHQAPTTKHNPKFESFSENESTGGMSYASETIISQYKKSANTKDETSNIDFADVQTADEEEFYELEKDVFSIVFLSPIRSAAFVYSLFIFFVQISILGLASYNLLADAPRGNFLNVPAVTDPEVIASQAFALLVTLIVNRDITNSLDLFQVAYEPDIQQKCPHAKKWKWFLGHALRFLEGLLNMMVSFLFIVENSDVLEIFLDFTAVQFVSELDDIGFFIADRGLLPFDLTNVTKHVKGVRMKFKQNIRFVGSSNASASGKKVKTGFFCLSALLLYSLWGWVRVLQMQGYFYGLECQRFQVNFEDIPYDFFDYVCSNEDMCPLGWVSRSDPLRYLSFSDMYIPARDDNNRLVLRNLRPIYYQRGRRDFGLDATNPSPPGTIFYCKEITAWVFAIEGVSKTPNVEQIDDGCSWLLRSQETEALFLNDVPEADWVTWTGILTESTVDITCVECSGKPNIEIADCTFHGSCENEVCKCEYGFMGPQCETCTACKNLNVTYTGSSITEAVFFRLDVDDDVSFSSYGRPVYYNGLGTEAPLVLLLFTGGEYWLWNILDRRDLTNEDELISFLETFHSTWDFREDQRPSFESEVTTSSEPTGLAWHNFTSREVFDIKLECADASEKEMCDFLDIQ